MKLIPRDAILHANQQNCASSSKEPLSSTTIAHTITMNLDSPRLLLPPLARPIIKQLKRMLQALPNSLLSILHLHLLASISDTTVATGVLIVSINRLNAEMALKLLPTRSTTNIVLVGVDHISQRARLVVNVEMSGLVRTCGHVVTLWCRSHFWTFADTNAEMAQLLRLLAWGLLDGCAEVAEVKASSWDGVACVGFRLCANATSRGVFVVAHGEVGVLFGVGLVERTVEIAWFFVLIVAIVEDAVGLVVQPCADLKRIGVLVVTLAG